MVSISSLGHSMSLLAYPKGGIRSAILDNLTMSTEQGFRAMSKFLDEYRKRVRDGGDLAAVLSDIQ